MCGHCGCQTKPLYMQKRGLQTSLPVTKINADLFSKNDQIAAQNRHDFTLSKTCVLNLLSSPGAGKTTLLEQTLKDLKEKINFTVIEGDLATSRDAQRILRTGVPAIQINTDGGCHLDAAMIKKQIQTLDLNKIDLLFIENVGNLVCPAHFDLGEKAKVVLLSVTEGEDKPLKYPQMFENSELVLLTKIDLLNFLKFDLDFCLQNIQKINPKAKILKVSAQSGEGLPEWYEWLKNECSI